MTLIQERVLGQEAMTLQRGHNAVALMHTLWRILENDISKGEKYLRIRLYIRIVPLKGHITS